MTITLERPAAEAPADLPSPIALLPAQQSEAGYDLAYRDGRWTAPSFTRRGPRP